MKKKKKLSYNTLKLYCDFYSEVCIRGLLMKSIVNASGNRVRLKHIEICYSSIIIQSSIIRQ